MCQPKLNQKMKKNAHISSLSWSHESYDRIERSSFKRVYRIQTVVKSVWDQVWEAMYREILVRNGKVGEEVRTKLVTQRISMLDLRLVVAISKLDPVEK